MSESIRVLHVDDDPEFVEMTAELLERADDRLSVDSETDANEGLHRLRTHDYSCVISDFEMPRLDGVGFLDAVRDADPDLPFILFTGKGSEEVASDAISSGVTDYLQKRGTTEQFELLANRVTNAVAQYRTRKRLLTTRSQLDQLHVATRELMACETAKELSERTCRVAREVLDLPLNSVHLYDGDRDGLVPVAYTERVVDIVGEPPSFSRDDGIAWTVFEDGEARIFGDVRESGGVFGTDTPIRSALLLPLGGYGVLLAASTTVGDFAPSDISTAKVLAANVETALDRVDRLRELRRTERRYRAIFNDPNILVGLLEPNGRLREVNNTALEYIESDTTAVEGERFWETPWFADAPEEREAVHALVTRAAGGEYVEFELDLVDPTGDPYTIDGVFRPVTNARGSVISIIISARDISDQKSTERRLWELRARYEHILEHLSDYVLIVEPTGEITYVSPAVTDVLDLDPDSVIGSNLLERAHPADRAKIQTVFDQCLEEPDHGVNIEYRTEAADGTYRWIEARGGNYLDDAMIEGLLVSVREIDERKSREQELQRLKDRYQAFTENTSDIITVVDDEGVIQYVSPSVANVLGYQPSDLIDEIVFEYIHPDDRRTVRETFDTMSNRIETVTSRIEYRVQDTNGSWIWLETVASNRRDSILDGYVITSRTITERKRYHEQLQRLHRRTYELMHTTTERETAETALRVATEDLEFPLAGFHLRSDSEDVLEPIAFVDKQSLFETPPNYDRGGERQSVAHFVWDVLENGEPRYLSDTGEYEDLRDETPVRSAVLYPLDEHGIFIVASTKPNAFDQADRTLLEILVTSLTESLDRTDRERVLRERSERLERQNERLEEFASIVSHDLRNPLRVAEGRLAQAMRDCESDNLAIVERSHDRIAELIDDVLTLARSGEEVVELDDVAIDKVAQDCWANVDTRGASLEFELERAIRADDSRMKQLFENLFRNAVEHGGNDVTVKIGEVPDGTGFFVEDTGPGIPDDLEEEVFSSGYSTSERGTGFGLAIVSRIVEAHGWDIRLNGSPASGARFEITGVDFGD